MTSTSAPGELEQALLEHLERRDVEVVRGLVEQQQVGRLEHQPGEHHARLLAAREPAHRRLELLRAEQEALRPAGDVDAAALEDHRVAVRGRASAAARRAGSSRERCWSNITTFRPGGVLDRARVGRLLAGEQPQQRALAAAVRAEQAEPHARREHEVEAAHDLALAVALASGPRRPRSRFVLRSRRREVEPDRRGLRARVEVARARPAAAAASSMRAWALRVRARALRESQSSSPRTRLRSDSW